MPKHTKDAPASGKSGWAWWLDKLIIIAVFAITGSSVMFVVRPFLSKVLDIEGSLRNGPNSFRLMYVLLVPPIYSILLVCLGTLVGRRKYFTKVALRMWGRILPASIVKKLQ
eukprot:RCo035032